MSLRINYHELARADLYDAWSWYEAREGGLGDRFIAAVDTALDQVAEWPNSGSPTIVVDGDVTERCIGTTGFPYRAAAGHRLFPAMWLSASTGMRRSELLGLQWHDLNVKHARLSINRGLVSVGYELRQSRGKTANARRTIDLDPTTIDVLQGWHALQSAERRAVGIEDSDQMFTAASGEPVHPHAISQAFERIVRRAGIPGQLTLSGVGVG